MKPFFLPEIPIGHSLPHNSNPGDLVQFPVTTPTETTHALAMAEPLPQQPEPKGIHWKCADCARMVLRHHKICICGAPKPVEAVPVKGTRFGFKATLPNAGLAAYPAVPPTFPGSLASRWQPGAFLKGER